MQSPIRGGIRDEGRTPEEVDSFSEKGGEGHNDEGEGRENG